MYVGLWNAKNTTVFARNLILIWKYLLFYLFLFLLVCLLVFLLVILTQPKKSVGMGFPIVTGPVYIETTTVSVTVTAQQKPKKKLISTPNEEKTCRQSDGRYIPIRKSCVCWAKAAVGYTNSVGAARSWPGLTSVPAVGAVVIQSIGKLGHAAVVTAIEGSLLHLKEANFVPGKVTTRTLSVDDKSILGYFIKE